MFSRRVAEQLRQLGHDVICVTERSDLRGQADADLLSIMAKEGRVIVTNNTRDFVRVASQATAAGIGHAGALLTSDRGMPRCSASLSRFAEIVDRFIREAPLDMLNQIRWLS